MNRRESEQLQPRLALRIWGGESVNPKPGLARFKLASFTLTTSLLTNKEVAEWELKKGKFVVTNKTTTLAEEARKASKNLVIN